MTVNKTMVEIQSELKAPKGQTNKFGGYQYRSCEDITEAAKPILANKECWLHITDEMIMLGDRFYVKATASVMQGDKAIATSSAYARESFQRKGMDDSQLTGSTSSYARKYALNGLFAIDDTKDADTTDNRGYEPISPEPINQEHVDGCYDMFMEVMTADVDEHDFKRMQTGYKRLKPDEQIAVFDKIGKDKPEGGRKGYKAIAKELLAMSDADLDNPDNREIMQ